MTNRHKMFNCEDFFRLSASIHFTFMYFPPGSLHSSSSLLKAAYLSSETHGCLHVEGGAAGQQRDAL